MDTLNIGSRLELFVDRLLVEALDGSALTLNLSTSAAGGARVELQDEAGRPLPGRALVDCPPIFTDAIEYPVAWKDGRDLLIWGGGPSQSLIPFGTPAAIRDRFRRLREELGAGGGYICAPSKTMLDETPVDNAIATVEVVVGHCLDA